MFKRLKEIEARKQAIKTEVEGADEKRMGELEAELTTLESEEAELRKKLDLQARIKDTKTVEPQSDVAQARAKKFAETGRLSMSTDETRAAILTSGNIATPTGVSGIHDANEGASAIVDMVYVADCSGMSTNRVAYVDQEATAAVQTEGSAIADGAPVYGYVDITAQTLGTVAQISAQVKKQSPLQYEAKTKNLALKALRKKVSDSVIVAKIQASELTDEVAADVASTKGKIDEKTLRKLVMNYGGDEISGGAGVLILNKTDLIAFGDVRGTNDKKAVYEIIPDANPNTGIIKDGGLAVKYVINSTVTACAGTSQVSGKKIKTMIFGDPKNFEVDLFGNYEVKVSEDFAFTSNMDTIRGTVDANGDVVVKHGFAILTIPAGT